MPNLVSTADYTLSQVPPQKVIWGVGVYGLDWGEKGKSAEYRNWGEADALAHGPTAQSGYDDVSQSPWVKYQRDGIQREVWYEDKRSFDAKLDLINARGMAGFGIWRLGQEDPSIWDSIKSKQKPVACQAVVQPDLSAGRRLLPTDRAYARRGVPQVLAIARRAARVRLPAHRGVQRNKLHERQDLQSAIFRTQPLRIPPREQASRRYPARAARRATHEGSGLPPTDDPTVGADTLYFPQVQHQMATPFLQYWQQHGGLAQFGFPISEPILEQSDVDGKTYLVQYLERARFEYHPEYKGTDAQVLLGLLGLNVSPCR